MSKLAVVLVAFLGLLVASASADDGSAKTGSLEQVFSKRSPSSDIKKIAERLKVSAPADYDLAKEPFRVFIPKAYDPAKPIGLIVLVNYKPSDTLPEPILPQLEAANIGLAVTKNCPEELCHRAGLALDAVFNLQEQYKIDPRRVYIFGGAERPSADGHAPCTAERLGLNFPEVFTGTFSIGSENFVRMTTKNGSFYPPVLPVPAPRQLAMAKDHPFVLGLTNQDEFAQLLPKSFTGAGFKHIKSINVTLQQYHYPNYTTDWVPDVLKFLDDTTAKLKLPPVAK